MTATDEQIAAMTKAFNNASERLPTMWSLSHDWNTLLSLLEDPDSDQDAIQIELQRAAGDIRIKGGGLAIVVEALDNLADWQRKQSQRMAAKARANEAHAERLKAYALSCMTSLGIERLETGTHTLSVRLNPPSVNVVDAAAVPSEFQRTKIEITPDKVSILAHHRQTGEVPAGVEIQRSQSLRVS